LKPEKGIDGRLRRLYTVFNEDQYQAIKSFSKKHKTSIYAILKAAVTEYLQDKGLDIAKFSKKKQ
jgi:hypothetical protein